MAKRKRADSSRFDDLIIGVLRENSQMSNAKMATKLNLSESAVRRRIANVGASGRNGRCAIEAARKVDNTTEFKNTVPVTEIDISGMTVDYLMSTQR